MLPQTLTPENIAYAIQVLQSMPDDVGRQAVMQYKDFPSSTPSHIMGHDAGGLFSTPAMEQRLFSAMTLPRRGLQDMLTLRRSIITDPQVGIITGVTASTGDEPDGVCDDPPVAGKLKLCVINDYPFARFARMTDVIDLSAVGKRHTVEDTMNYDVVGNPFNARAGRANLPTVPGATSLRDAVNLEVRKSMFQFAVAMQRDFSRLFYTGDPTNNTAGGGYKEFRGLDLLINNNYSDMVSGNDCDRVDSYIASFGDLEIETNANAYVQQIVEITNLLQRRAEIMGLDPASWVMVMPYNLFRVTVFLWASTYYTYRISVNTSNQSQFSGEFLANQMLDMLNNRYLLVDGGRIPVITDEAITETVVGGGVNESEVRWVCMSVLGGAERTTFMEYFDYTGQGAAMRSLTEMGYSANAYYRWFDNGRFMAHYKPPNNFCIQMLVLTEPRLRLNTPFLCARLTDVRYTPVIPEESSFPGDSTYLDGGNTGPNPGAPGTEAEITACADNAPGNLTFTLDTTLNCTLGTNVVIIIGSLQVPAVISAGNNSTSVTVDFTTAATPTPLQAVTCAGLSFVGGTIQCNF